MAQQDLSGMDISQIRSMARDMDRKADEIRSLIDGLSGQVEVAAWAGGDRERFVQEWRTRHAVALRRVADNLDVAARHARDHAADQERVSRAAGGAGGGGGRGW